MFFLLFRNKYCIKAQTFLKIKYNTVILANCVIYIVFGLKFSPYLEGSRLLNYKRSNKGILNKKKIKLKILIINGILKRNQNC